MAYILPFLAFFLSNIFSSSCFSSLRAKTSKPVGFSTRLINIHSVHSPYYNPNLTRSDRIQAAVRRSYARQNHIQAIQSNTVSLDDISTTARPESHEYMMEYYIGKPVPIKSYGIIDTGSQLFWLQCLPCERCFKQSTAYFDPLKSTSYVPLTCDDFLCRRMPGRKCSELNLCQYEIHYGDGSYSEGSIAYETVFFRDHERKVGNYTWDFLVFGCGHYNLDPIEDNNAPGIIGLNRSPTSLIRQLSLKEQFAYCFGDPMDVHPDGYIKFGDAVSLHGSRTPILSLGGKYNTYYYLNLEGISVGDTMLLIPEETFTLKSGKGTGGFMIDSGAAYTMLNTTAFTMLVNELDEKMDKKHYVSRDQLLKVCYVGEASDFVSAPLITFHFSGADFKLKTWSTWVIDDDIYCLGIVPTDGTSILGNYQQQDTEIGFDLQQNLVYFNSMLCSTLGL